MSRLAYYTVLFLSVFQICSPHRLLASPADGIDHVPDDSSRIKEMLGIARGRLNAAPREKADLDTAYYYTHKAMMLSESMHSRIWKGECLQVLGNYYYESGDKISGREYFLQAFTESRKAGSLHDQLTTLRLMGNYVCADSTLYPALLSARDRLIADNTRPEDQKTIIDTVKSIVNYLLAIGDKALNRQVMNVYAQTSLYALGIDAKSPRINLNPYACLFVYNFYRGNVTKAFSYALESVKIAEKGVAEADEEIAYVNMAYIYFQLGNMEQSIFYYKKGLAVMKKMGMGPNGNTLKGLTRALLKAGRPREALELLESKYGPVDSTVALQKEAMLPECIGMCYEALEEYGKAEQFLLLSWEKSKKLGKDRVLSNDVSLGNFYMQTKQYEKARNFLIPLVTDTNLVIVPPSIQANAHFLLFEVDSAEGDYLTAITQLNIFKAINDSIFNATRNEQVEELKVQYSTEKKDKDIELLNKQATLQASQMQQDRLKFAYETEIHNRDLERISYKADRKDDELKLADYAAKEKDKNLLLKQQNIELLVKQKELQQAALRQTRFLRDVFIAGVICLAILLGLLLNRYWLKQKSNRVLQAQQEKINRSNVELQQLNEAQQKLLTEKEWLVKEVHHRVKNNLQIIISLLNAQSDSLEGSTAQHAIQVSRERMHAIALIHQKLYLLDESLAIDMHSYIHELVTYLGNSFSASGKIHFNLEVEHIELNISQAVPLGLILNEAITNAVKYAFPGDRTGTVHIILQQVREQEILLSIADDGQGFEEYGNTPRKNSLGIELIELFAEQMSASLHRSNDDGVSITLVFRQLIPETANGVAEAL